MRNITSYHFKIAYHVDYVDKVLHLISQIVFESLHKDEDLENEKKIISEEIKTVLDDAYESIDDYTSELMFKNSSLSKPVLGFAKTLKDIKPSSIRKFYKSYYVPNNMVLSIAGKMPNNINDLIKTHFNKYKLAKLPIYNLKPYVFSSTGPELKIINKQSFNQSHINISFPGFSILDKNTYVLELIALHLGGNMSSVLYRELREKNNLVYNVESNVTAYEEGGYLSIYTSVDNKNVQKTLDIIFEQLQLVKHHKYENYEVLSVNQIHSLELEWENSYNIADHYADQLLLYPKVSSLKEFVKLYRNITKQDLIEITKSIINFKKMKIVIIGNIKKNEINLTKIS